MSFENIGRRTLGAAVLAATLVAGLLATGGRAEAQTYPTKPIRVILALSAGSAADIIPRLVYEQVQQQIGQSIILENRPGAGGTIAANAVAKSDPDGYTLLAHSNGHTMAPAFFKQVPYDTVKDFAGIVPLASLPHVLVIATAQKINSIQELVAAAKTRPGGLTFGAVMGTAPHLNAIHFIQTMKIEGRAVPFKGAPEALTEVLAGRVDIYFSPVTPALPFLQDATRMKALAVTSKKRSIVLPDVPTTFEQGYPDSEFGLWVGSYAPAKTPRDIINKLHDETVKAINSPKVLAKLKDLGAEPMIMAPEELDALVKREVVLNADLARKAGIMQN